MKSLYLSDTCTCLNDALRVHNIMISLISQNDWFFVGTVGTAVGTVVFFVGTVGTVFQSYTIEGPSNRPYSPYKKPTVPTAVPTVPTKTQGILLFVSTRSIWAYAGNSLRMQHLHQFLVPTPLRNLGSVFPRPLPPTNAMLIL